MTTSKLVLAAIVAAGFGIAATESSHAHSSTHDIAGLNTGNSAEYANPMKLRGLQLVHKAIEPDASTTIRTAQRLKTRVRIKISTPRRHGMRRGNFKNPGGGPQAVGLLLPAVQAAREAPRTSTPPSSPPPHDDCMSCD